MDNNGMDSDGGSFVEPPSAQDSDGGSFGGGNSMGMDNDGAFESDNSMGMDNEGGAFENSNSMGMDNPGDDSDGGSFVGPGSDGMNDGDDSDAGSLLSQPDGGDSDAGEVGSLPDADSDGTTVLRVKVDPGDRDGLLDRLKDDLGNGAVVTPDGDDDSIIVVTVPTANADDLRRELENYEEVQSVNVRGDTARNTINDEQVDEIEDGGRPVTLIALLGALAALVVVGICAIALAAAMKKKQMRGAGAAGYSGRDFADLDIPDDDAPQWEP